MPEIEVHAPPRGQQRHRTGADGRRYTPTPTLEAQRLIREAWVKSGFGMQAGRHLGVRVDVTAVFLRPGHHYGTGRNAGRLRASAPRWPTTRSSFDRDNLDKLVLDALWGCAFYDDSCVVDGRVRKVYARDGEVPGWRIGVYAMEDTEDGDDHGGNPAPAAR